MNLLALLIDTQIKAHTHCFEALKEIEVSPLISLWEESKSLFQFIEQLPSSASIYLYTYVYDLFEVADQIKTYLKTNDIPSHLTPYESLAISIPEVNLIRSLLNQDSPNRSHPFFGSFSHSNQCRPDFERFLEFIRTIKRRCIEEYLADLSLPTPQSDYEHIRSFIPSHLNQYSLPDHPTPSTLYAFFQKVEYRELSTYLHASFPKDAFVFQGRWGG